MPPDEKPDDENLNRTKRRRLGHSRAVRTSRGNMAEARLEIGRLLARYDALSPAKLAQVAAATHRSQAELIEMREDYRRVHADDELPRYPHLTDTALMPYATAPRADLFFDPMSVPGA